MYNYDLHCHSTASDGSCAPEELIELAVENEIDFLALTDHDTVEGIEKAVLASENSTVKLVAGVEISVSWENITVHILGLGISPENTGLKAGLAALREFRKTRAIEIGELLDQAGIPDTYQACLDMVGEGLISRTHFARAIIEQGRAKDMRQVFKKFLVKNKPGYVPGEWASLEQAVNWITSASGIAVIAHPARYKISAGKLRKLIENFVSFGGAGIEVISGNQSDQDCAQMAHYADRYKLVSSVGSDFHGSHHPWRKLGNLKALPSDLTPVWEHEHWPY